MYHNFISLTAIQKTKLKEAHKTHKTFLLQIIITIHEILKQLLVVTFWHCLLLEFFLLSILDTIHVYRKHQQHWLLYLSPLFTCDSFLQQQQQYNDYRSGNLKQAN